MRIGSYAKAQNDRKRYQIDYTDWLDIGESVISVIFTIPVNTVSLPLVVDGVAILPGLLAVQYYVSGGVDNTAYEIIATLTTSLGQIRVDGINFTIREP